MKATILSVATLSLFQLALAQPHRRHAHQLEHLKRDIITITETYIAEATAVPNVIVLVDPSGIPVSTMTEGFTAANVYKVPAATPTTSSTPAPVVNIVQVPTTTSTSSSTSSIAVATSSAAPAPVGASSGYGLAYSPYNKDGSCKDSKQVSNDFASLGEYGLIRTYGTDCDTISNVYAACKATGKKLFAGIFNLGDLPAEIATLVAGVKGDWSAIHTISVGNELVNSGQASAADVVFAIGAARALLRTAGYQGPVVTVDTLAAVVNGNAVLCDKSDYCAVNAHPFFDSTATASGAGKWLSDNIATLKSKLANPSQTIIITETGWPSDGTSNGAAVPSPENQKAALSSIKSTFSSNPSGVIFLSAFNRQWIKNTGQFGQEPWFGILGDCPTG